MGLSTNKIELDILYHLYSFRVTLKLIHGLKEYAQLKELSSISHWKTIASTGIKPTPHMNLNKKSE